MDYLSLIISIIGCTTGLLSLIIVIVYNAFQIGNQTFSVSKRRGTYYFKASETTVNGPYNPEICAVVSLKVTNRSSYPITIDDAYIIAMKNRHMSEFQYDNIEISTSNGIQWQDSEKIASLPLKLDPFETKYFALAFPFFHHEVKSFGESVKVPITIITARKEYIVKVTIPEYHSLFEHAQKTPSPRS